MLTVFLDANVLAKPFTRTSMWAGAALIDCRVVLSAHAEQEAERHLGPRTSQVSVHHARNGLELSAQGAEAGSYRSTDAKDRRISAEWQPRAPSPLCDSRRLGQVDNAADSVHIEG